LKLFADDSWLPAGWPAAIRPGSRVVCHQSRTSCSDVRAFLPGRAPCSVSLA